MANISIPGSRFGRMGVVLAGLAMVAAGLNAAPANATSDVTSVDPDLYRCAESGFVDFENLPDKTDLTVEAINGVQFTTTDGFTWLVGDFSTGDYNGKYPSGDYTSQGTHWAWLGENQGSGRIDFPDGHVSFFSILVSVGTTPVYLEAYDRKGQLLETAGPSAVNTGTGLMDELRIERDRADIDHVIIHDSGNYFLVDAVCTDARGVDSSDDLQWVQLGDSYSAGVGLGKVTEGCDQDAGAYTPIAFYDLNKSGQLASDVLINASCTGNTTADYFASQAGLISRTADIATMTIGGNDAYFAQKVAGCWAGDCGPDLVGVEAGTERDKLTWDDLFGRLVDTYFDVRTRMASDGHLYVLSYPIPFGLGSGQDCNGFEYDEQLAANALATRLGDTIYLAVEAANGLLVESGRQGNVHFVEWRTGPRIENLYTVPEGFPNAGERFPVVVSPNGLCTKDGKSFLNDFKKFALVNVDRSNSLHPNRVGYGYAAEMLKQAVLEDFG